VVAVRVEGSGRRCTCCGLSHLSLDRNPDRLGVHGFGYAYVIASPLDDFAVRFSGIDYSQEIMGQNVVSPATALGTGDNTKLLSSISGSGYAYQLRQLSIVPSAAPYHRGRGFILDSSALPANILGIAVYPYQLTVELSSNTMNEMYVFNETTESAYISLYYDVLPSFTEPAA
jgi:hypothetical protein